MLGWMLASGLVDWAPYRFFVLLSSAVRGPFMPTYLHAMHWTAPLLRCVWVCGGGGAAIKTSRRHRA
jgi:hypothetical protein